MQIAAFSLAEVTYAGGEIGYQIQESVSEATFKITTDQENVSGVIIPAFRAVHSKAENGTASDRSQLAYSSPAGNGLTGLGRGGQQITKCRETFTKAVETLVELASLQVRFPALSHFPLWLTRADGVRDP